MGESRPKKLARKAARRERRAQTEAVYRLNGAEAAQRYVDSLGIPVRCPACLGPSFRQASWPGRCVLCKDTRQVRPRRDFVVLPTGEEFTVSWDNSAGEILLV